MCERRQTENRQTSKQILLAFEAIIILIVDLRDFFFRFRVGERGKKKRKKSSENDQLNDQLTGHFQSLFLFFFIFRDFFFNISRTDG